MQTMRRFWLIGLLAIVTFNSGCGKRTNDPSAFSIPEIQPVGDTETETRVRVAYLKDEQSKLKLLFKMEFPNYQLEEGPAKSPGMGGEREFLYWAPGAVHEWTDAPVEAPEEMTASGSRLRPGGYEIIDGKKYFSMSKAFVVLTEGYAESANRLAGWTVVRSNPAFPLTFKLIKGRGYIHMCGEGTIKDPDGKVHNLGPGSLDEWIRGLRNADSTVREGSALALGWVGKGKKSVIQALLEALKDQAPLARRSAIEALGRLADPSALDSLNSLKVDHSWTEETAEWSKEQIQKASKNQ